MLDISTFQVNCRFSSVIFFLILFCFRGKINIIVLLYKFTCVFSWYFSVSNCSRIQWESTAIVATVGVSWFVRHWKGYFTGKREGSLSEGRRWEGGEGGHGAVVPPVGGVGLLVRLVILELAQSVHQATPVILPGLTQLLGKNNIIRKKNLKKILKNKK